MIRKTITFLAICFLAALCLATFEKSGEGGPVEVRPETQAAAGLKSAGRNTVASPPVSYDVVKVVDGDTIDVVIGGTKERVRLLGINTPETVDPRKPVECYGKEASDKARSVLSGKKVYLEPDPSQGDRDKYGRLLRYVFLEDGTDFDLLMINEGYAYEYTYDLPYKYQKQFKAAQKEAEAAGRGLWAPGVCGK